MLSRELKTRCCGSIVPARAAFADQGNRIYGGADFLGGEAWRAAVGNVCERIVGFGREALESGGVHQQDQIPAAGRERRASRKKEQLKRRPKRKARGSDQNCGLAGKQKRFDTAG